MECSQNPKFQCHTKENDFFEKLGNQDNAYTKVQHLLLGHRTSNGCDIKQYKEVKHIVDCFGYKGCLCQFEHPLIHSYIWMVDAYDKGILPDRGGLFDQTSKTIEIINFIQSIKNEYRIKMEEDHLKQLKSQR